MRRMSLLIALAIAGFAVAAVSAAADRHDHHDHHDHQGDRQRDHGSARFDSWRGSATTTTAAETTADTGTTTDTPTTTTTDTTTTTATTTTTTTTTPATTTVVAEPGSYPLHTNVVSTTFWVGEIFDSSLADGSQACSTYDSQWAYHWSGGAKVGTDPSTDCAGAPIGGCDGIPSGSGSTFTCSTEKRTAANGYFPTSSSVHPAENPFYLDLPFDDVNDKTAFNERCQVIPWASTVPASKCGDSSYSYMKNRWVELTGPNGNTCYGQVEDAGPSHGSLYHDAAYVFGANDAQPVQGQFNNAGLDVSPALNGCLGFKELDGDTDKVSWRFVDSPPAGPWTQIVTTSQVQ